MTGNPMVTLNRAAAMVDGPAEGLRAGDVDGAIANYRTAAGRTSSLAERTYLMTQASRLSASHA